MMINLRNGVVIPSFTHFTCALKIHGCLFDYWVNYVLKAIDYM